MSGEGSEGRLERVSLPSYPYVTYPEWRRGRHGTDNIGSCGKPLKKISIIHFSIGALLELIPNMVKLVASHAERMLIEYFMKCTGTNCTCVARISVRECLQTILRFIVLVVGSLIMCKLNPKGMDNN